MCAKEKNRLFPEDKGRLVTIFLINYFRRYVGYDFTAKLESELDDITSGETGMAKRARTGSGATFKAAIDETADLRITEVLDKINEVLEPHLFPPTEDGRRSPAMPELRRGPVVDADRPLRRCLHRLLELPRVSLYPRLRPSGHRTGKRHPPRRQAFGSRTTGDNIWIHKGRFGPYAQRGEVTEENQETPTARHPRGVGTGRGHTGTGHQAAWNCPA